MQSLILYFIALKEKRLMACIILKMTLLVKIRLTFEKRAALQRRPLSQSPCPTQADGLSTLMTRNTHCRFSWLLATLKGQSVELSKVLFPALPAPGPFQHHTKRQQRVVKKKTDSGVRLPGFES